MQQKMIEGIRLFNSQRYFEAHEALESVWLEASGDRKTVLQGLIQVAAAFHHRARGNRAGFRLLLVKGCSKLAGSGVEFEGIDLDVLRGQLQSWQEHLLSSCLPAPPLPLMKCRSKPQHF